MSTTTTQEPLDEAIIQAMTDLHAKGRPWVIRLTVVRHDLVQDALEAGHRREREAERRLARLVASGSVEKDWVLGRYRLAEEPPANALEMVNLR